MTCDRLIFFIFLDLICLQAASQELSNLRSKLLLVEQDTTQIDTLSIIPGSFKVLSINDENIDPSWYELDYFHAKFIRHSEKLPGSVKLTYRVFPFDFSKKYYINKKTEDKDEPVTIYTPSAKKSGDIDLFGYSQLTKNGNISRGITFGNNQDLALNSSLDLQLSGMLTKDIEIQAAMTDNNIPIEPEGNTAELQDFDQVYIQLKTDQEKLLLGDYEMRSPQNGHFLSFLKKTQGIDISKKWDVNQGTSAFTRASVGFSRGRFARNEFNGREGDQGPYRLTGANNELFIIIIAGTERVYLNGNKLQRGEQNDYVIDYNTGEIIFTAKHLITKFDRIVVEFQYAERNYERSVVYAGGNVKQKRLNISANIYSEQDNKNRPFFQELKDEDKILLSEIGDSLNKAIIPKVDSVEYNPDRILYKKIDTAGFQDIYVYSTDPNKAFYSVKFSFVGEGNGDYALKSTSVNGKVFEWIKPINGKSGGSYAAVSKLAAPNKSQMATIATTYDISKNNTVGVELAGSSYDKNTFSSKDANDDHDFALFVFSKNKANLTSEKKPVQLLTDLSYERKQKNFNPIERYRHAEFDRIWNKKVSNPNEDLKAANEDLANVDIGLKKDAVFSFSTESMLYKRDNLFTGFNNNSGGFINFNDYTLKLSNDITLANLNYQDEKRRFSTQEIDLSKKLKPVIIGGNYTRENNRFLFDSNEILKNPSFKFEQWKIYAQSPDSTSNYYKFGFGQRIDFLPLNTAYAKVSKSDNLDISAGLNKNIDRQIKWIFHYRKFNILKDSLLDEQNEETFLNRLELDFNFFDKLIKTKTFYQTGSGSEQKTEYQYVKINSAGQGNYIWNDYNENGIQELNEFQNATSATQYRANYIRLITPSNEYVKSSHNQLNQNVEIDPAHLWGSKKGIKKTLSHISNQTNYRIERKTLQEKGLQQFNPFVLNIEDTALIRLGSSIRSTFYYGKNDPVLGFDFTISEQANKTLLTNGFDSYLKNEKIYRIRWNMTRLFSFYPTFSHGIKKYNSDFFTTRNYNITFKEAEAKFMIQPSNKFRTSIYYNLTDQQNQMDENPEKAFQHKIGNDLTFSFTSKGYLNISLSYISIKYDGNPNSEVGFELLQGLQPGNNFTLDILFAYNLQENLQINILYSGRKSDSIKDIHTANVNVRYLF